MLVSRRALLTVIGGLTVGYGASSAVGAFDQIELDRDVSFNVDTDDAGLLTLHPHPLYEGSLEVTTTEAGLLTVSLDDEEEGVINYGGTTDFHDVFLIDNETNDDIEVEVDFIEADGSTSDAIVSYIYEDPTNTHPFSLKPTGLLDVGIRFIVDDDAAAASVESVDTMRITAEPA